MRKLLISILYLGSLFSSILTTTENVPDSIVEGVVSAVSGDIYLSEEDLVIQGVEPVRIRKSYISQKGSGTWSTAQHLIAQRRLAFAMVPETNGTMIGYRYERDKKDHKMLHFKPLDLGQDGKGLTNTARGFLSAQTNLKNQTLTLEDSKEGEILKVHCPDGSCRSYREMHGVPPTKIGKDASIKIQHYYMLMSEQLPNGNFIFYGWDKDNRLNVIRTTDPTKTINYAQASINYHGHISEKGGHKYIKNASFDIKTSDQRALQYLLSQDGKHKHKARHLIYSVTAPGFPDQLFHYRGGEKYCASILKKIELPEGRQLEIEYYAPGANAVAGETIHVPDGNHPVCTRVKTLSAPVASDGSLRITHSFLYDLDNRSTSVIDCEGHATKYRWDSDFRLTEIRRQIQRGATYSSELFVWGQNADAGNLVCKAFKDESDQALFATRYFYDSRGNVSQETYYGNLSGLSQNPALDSSGMPQDAATESYTKSYQYSQEGKNLLTRAEEQNGLVTLYTYLPNTNLKSSELTCDSSGIILRKFYFYNQHHILIQEIEDDGSGSDASDLTNVIQRKIKVITPRTQEPYRGMPQIIEEKYWNGQTEALLKKTVLHYTAGAKISQKDIYDAEGRFRYSLCYRHDAHGRLIEESNALGQSAKSGYDSLGNKIFFQDFGSSKTTYFVYDKSNRLIKTLEKDPAGKSRETLYFYDLKSRLIKTIDYLGQETSFYYDPYGNLLEKHEPSYQLHSDTPSITKTRHDAAGRQISKTDGNGNTTLTTYNAYHSPATTTHPDGSIEKNIYNLNGTLRVQINCEGTETHITYDALKRPLLKQVIANGQTVSQETLTYHGQLLTSHTDSDGNTTTYSYDGAGRRIAEEKAGERVEFSYDSLGRLSKTTQGDQVTIQEYDLLDRVIEERVEDTAGTLYSKLLKAYDPAGNLKQTTRFIQGQRAEDLLVYDSFNRLIQKTDPLGYTTKYEYDEGKTEIKTTRDPLGNITQETFNCHQKLLQKTRQDSNGKVLLTETLEYDNCGNVISQEAEYSDDQQGSRITRWEWIYDNRDRLIELREAAHLPTPRITRYSYTLQGDLKELFLPSGITLETTYDPLGRKISEISTDNTVHQTFSYNGQGQLIEAHDHVQNHHITRHLDAFGRILSETLDGTHTVASTYDILGRKTSLTLPGERTVSYQYDPCHLRQIQFKNSTHAFNEYDLSGNLLSETTPTTTITHSYDLLGRHITTNSAPFYQTVEQFDPAGNVLAFRTNKEESRFTYDTLYHLTSEQGSHPHNYAYNSLGSRLQTDNEAHAQDDLFQYTHLDYDENGNPIQNEDQTYQHDALGRLISVETPTYRAYYTYDALHRRRTKKLYTQNIFWQWTLTTDLVFIYDDYNEIGEMTFQGKCKALRVLGRTQTSEAGSAAFLELESRLFIPYHDLFGNVAALTTLDGTIVQETRYSAFGIEATQTSLSLQNPWLFASKRLDEETQLILFGRRYYNPKLGQWLTPDPAGFTDAFNLYLFVHNNPLSHTDLYGYFTENPSLIKPNWSPVITMPIAGNLFSLSQQEFTPAGLHTLDFGKSDPNLGFGFANGINNTFLEAKHSGSMFSEMTGGYNFDLQYNPTRGILSDVNKCRRALLTPEETDGMHPIRKSWDHFFDKNPLGHYLQVCHSGGTIHVKRVLENYPVHFRSRITVLAIAPATYIDRHLCENVLHLISERDYFVHGFTKLEINKELRNRNNPNVVWLPAHRNAPGIDHSAGSSTYTEKAEGFMYDFIKSKAGNR